MIGKLHLAFQNVILMCLGTVKGDIILNPFFVFEFNNKAFLNKYQGKYIPFLEEREGLRIALVQF